MLKAPATGGRSIAGGRLPVRRSRAGSAWLAGGVLALVAFGSAGCQKGDQAAPASSTGPAASAAANAGPAADGTFAFTVTGSKCGVKTIGPADLSKSATGQYCLVDVRVKNVGKTATLLDGGAQRAIDIQGKQYPIADVATVFLNNQDPSLLEQIAPGAEVRGVLPFQVADNTRLTAVVLHGATSTPGVRVALP